LLVAAGDGSTSPVFFWRKYMYSDENEIRKILTNSAVQHYRNSDKSRWRSAVFCSRIVGKYNNFATSNLATDMGVSVDTVEDLAHSYWIFEELCKYDGGTFRNFVFAARRAPYIYYSHFRALYDIKKRYDLNINEILEILMDIVQAEGTIASRDIEKHAKERYGKQVAWDEEARKLMKKLLSFQTNPDIPKNIRKKTHELIDAIGNEA
jgi:hypothetical protein